MRFFLLSLLVVIATSCLGTDAKANPAVYSWENSLDSWLVDVGNVGATAVSKSVADGIPSGAITDGDYALELGRAGSNWTAVLRADSPLIRQTLLANTTIDLDIFLPAGSYQPNGKIQFQIQGESMNFSTTQTFNAVDNSYHVSWDYADHSAFNPFANWSQLTMILPGGGINNPVYVDNFRISNRHNIPSDYTVDGDYKVYMNEEFDGDLNIFREPGTVYSGPNTVSAGDGNLVRVAAGERGWRTRGSGGHEHFGRTHLDNGEAGWNMDPWYEGTTGSPLGVNPFQLQNGKLHISADPIDAQVRAGLPAQLNGIDVQNLMDYTTGALTTQNLLALKYGRFEMRAKMPAGRGLWPAFWLLPSSGEWPPEIDIVETHGQRRHQVSIANHIRPEDFAAGFDKSVNGWVNTDVLVPGQFIDITDDFHDYMVDWNSEEIIWYFDGIEIGRTPTPPSMHQEMYMIVNMAVGGPGSWPGPTDATTALSNEMIIDYVRASQLRADLDGDGLVDSDDLSLWQSNYGIDNAGDTDDDGDTDGADFLAWQTGFVAASNNSNVATIPEPATGTLTILLGLWGAVTRRRTANQ